MNMFRLLRRCHLPVLALISFAQPLALIICRLAPQAGALPALFPVLCMPMLLFLIAVPGRVRPMALGACLLALCAAGHAFLSGGAAMIMTSAGCAAILAYALSLADREPAQASPMFYFACVLAQIAALFLLHHADEAVRGMPLMRGAFYLWLPLFLLAFNRISLNSATLARYRLSAGMARTGAALTLAVYLIALLLCAMPAVVSGFIWLFRALREGSIQLLLFLIHLFPAESTGSSAGGGMLMLPPGSAPVQAEPSILAAVLEKIAAAFSMVVLIAGSALLARLLALALVRLARGIIAQLQRYAAAVAEDYEDEITDTRGENGERTFLALRRKAKRKMSYPDTPSGRIRRRYAQLLARHPAWTDSSTARENLSAGAAALYERARYSRHEPGSADAQRFEQETR